MSMECFSCSNYVYNVLQGIISYQFLTDSKVGKSWRRIVPLWYKMVCILEWSEYFKSKVTTEKANSKYLIPSMYILPQESYNGIILNLAELRLYFYKTYLSF